MGATVYEKGGQTIFDVENLTCLILILHQIPNKDNRAVFN